MIEFAVLGLGSRGRNYGGKLNRRHDAKIVAVCDKFSDKAEKYGTAWGVLDGMRFTSDDDVF
jgi:hypothetical protein